MKKKILIGVGAVIFVLLSIRNSLDSIVQLIGFIWVIPALIFVFRAKQSVLRKLLIALGMIILWITIIPLTTKVQTPVKPPQDNKQEPSISQTIQEVKESPEDQIKKLISKKLEGKNNMGFPYIEVIDVSKNQSEKYDVSVGFNADDNLTKGLIKVGVQIKTAEIMTALYTTRNDIGTVKITSIFPLQDKYGKPFRGDVYVAEMEASEAKKVNWSLDQTTLAQTILPKIYKVSYPYKIF